MRSKYLPTTMWTELSKIKFMISLKEGIDVEKYQTFNAIQKSLKSSSKHHGHHFFLNMINFGSLFQSEPHD